jgi:cytochrome c oxidase cbb3-type subunit I/II
MMMLMFRYGLLWVIFFFTISNRSMVYGASPFIQGIAEQEFLVHGKAAYEKRCIGCHGIKGDGKGEAAVLLDPKPRDFTSGIYKFRSSPLGSLPSDQDLMQILSKGVLGTSMPSFADVPEKERFTIIQYIKTFSPLWKDPANHQAAIVGAPMPMDDFRKPDLFLKRVEKGRVIFLEACIICHGKNGEGNGPGAADLINEWNEKIVPGNLTKTYIKSGKSVKDIYLRILTGVGGTPMPAFKDTYTDDQLWDVAAWVLYLRGVYNGVYDSQKLPIKLIEDQELQN